MELSITNEEKHFSNPIRTENNLSPERKLKLAKASKDFESMLTSMMLKSMTSTTGGLFGSEENGFGGDVMESLFEQEIASYMTRSGGFGLAEKIYEKLTGEKLPNEMNIRIKAPASERIPYGKVPFNKNTANVEATSEIKPSGSSLERLKKYDNIIRDASKTFGVDENLIRSVILAESAANEKAISRAKAKGLMQLMDGTAKDLGVKNVWDPKENIFGGTKYLAQMLKRFDGDVRLTLAAYNAGPGAVDKFKGIPPYNETKNYVTRVIGYLNYMGL